MITARVSMGGNAIASVSTLFQTNWPLTLTFCMYMCHDRSCPGIEGQGQTATRLVWPRSLIEDSFLVEKYVNKLANVLVTIPRQYTYERLLISVLTILGLLAYNCAILACPSTGYHHPKLGFQVAKSKMSFGFGILLRIWFGMHYSRRQSCFK